MRIHAEHDIEHAPDLQLPDEPLPVEPLVLDEPEPLSAWTKFCKTMGW